MEKTLVILKPDCIKNKFVGKVINRLEESRLSISEMKMQILDEAIVKEHYIHHSNKPFFGEIVEFMTSGPVVTLIIEGENVIKVAREIIGHKDPSKAQPGTIRADYAISVNENIIHASDSIENAEIEIARFFEKKTS
ncbi:nucleoside-diphosphate kinase [Mycoplasmatota bacterium WC44]